MINTYLEEFNDYMSMNKGRSSGTIKVYESCIKEFFNYMYIKKKINDEQEITREFLESITRKDGRSYIAWCSQEGNNATTRNRKVVTIRTFFTYLEDTEGIVSDITKLELAKTEKTVPKYLTKEEANMLLNNAKGNKRDYAMLLMFLTCGLRVSEMISLNRNQIRLDNTMVITGKGNKQRTIYLTDELVSAINSYLITRTDSNDCMWLSTINERMSKAGMQLIVKRYLTQIGREDCSVHKLRHTFATIMYQSGSADLLQLQQILGHSSPSTTQIYTHVADEQLAECVKHNPLLSSNVVVLAS